jgi:CHAT domain-containing protein
VLSACETAVGSIGNGIEVSALNYSFMRNGGAKSVLASLWQVNDGSTSDFMRKFYINLRTGENSRVEALRKVQLDFLQSQEFSHPYYWSGFTLTGNSN